MTQSVPVVTRTSKAAIFSMVFGIFGCVPGFGLVAFLLGSVGIVKTRVREVRGRWMAIIGLVLGLLFSLGYVGMGIAAWYGIKIGTETYHFGEALAKTDGQKLVTSLVDVNGPTMQTTRSLTASDVEKFRVDLKKLGKPKGISVTELVPEGLGAGMKMRISARVEFEGGFKTVRVWVKANENSNDGVQVDKFEVVD